MTVRAKFEVTAKTFRKPYQVYGGAMVHPVGVEFAAVMASEGEDSIFGKATPSVTFNMVVHNPEAAAQFEVGKKYYVDFIKAEA